MPLDDPTQVEMQCRAGHRFWQLGRYLAQECPFCWRPAKRTGRFQNPGLLADAPRPWVARDPFLQAIDPTVEHRILLGSLRFSNDSLNN